jgi:membrane protein required for colicin V production
VDSGDHKTRVLMLIDIIAIILVCLAVFKGYSKGFVVAVFSFLAFFIGLAAAVKLSAVVADYLKGATNISQKWLPVLAFTLVFIIVVLLVRLGARAIEGALRLAMLGWLNKLGGIFFYGLLYLFIFSIVLFYAEKLHIIKAPVLDASLTAAFIKPFGPKALEALGWLVPAFKNMFTDLENFFGGFSKRGA